MASRHRIVSARLEHTVIVSYSVSKLPLETKLKVVS
jgi:hypothetical protein